ncbi:anti-sigma regulatory factor (Ser/Thr protein kinase) [Streptomyces sp. SAI-133]|uniref:nitrate- and nitrite sensing domain-containing protein n=1 Tax=unclassified Streptomyces TaxID=2593676 RepID=UPI0024769B1F|nr:nitrate- and nitrite sensing domain-containing protein [Streptomyces sp. SAI-133]MDH6583216.1 anti-sigma regulatory factor (Ser/Thr protein kinase) [Streptomyces sp. SAI-133]
MRFRGKSIRRKIVALLLVPLVSLIAVWGFATVLTGREVAQLFQVSTVTEKLGYPIEDTVRVLQQERRQTLVYLADPRASDALSALRSTRSASDDAIAEFRRGARDPDVRDGIDQDDDERLTAVLDAFDGIDSLRRSVEDGTLSRIQALDQYNRLVDPAYALLATLDGIDSVELDKQARALVNITRARELLSREDALLGSALVVGKLTRDEIRDVSDLVAQRTLMYDVSLGVLPASERERYERFWKNAGTAPLRSAEQSVSTAEPGTDAGVSAKSWDTAAGTVLDELAKLDDQAGDRLQDRVRPDAMGVIVKAAAVGVLGLIALLFSLVLSVRVGRGLIRDLRQLRLEAHEASGVRLPSVMRRLSVGEQVDVETEVPRLEYDKNEMGEVGQALNTLQRAAVEAAVKQAELRAGVSEVFVNLARRSQVLLHKQLTLLDTMERRTEDTDELADLFRLDHLTTRMRRHAEGLVILSGAAPSRQWRKPVQLMDVVRAAVAEVEDYERIEVRRLPRVAVTGPAVADLTHLVAELLENATVFSPPHTAVQVLGERVANGFTLEIHDRGLGMAADALLDANLRLAETPEFELSDTDRLGLFVVSRLAQRQNVRVSLQPSPYGGTTAVVFIPDALLTDDVPDTNGIGFRLDRPRPSKEAELEAAQRVSLTRGTGQLPPAILDGPVELEAPVDLDTLNDLPGVLDSEDSERGGLFRPRRSLAQVDDEDPAADGADIGDDGPGAPVSLSRRRTPKLVSSHGRPVTDERTGREEPDRPVAIGPVASRSQTTPAAGPDSARSEPPTLPSRRRAAALRRSTDVADRLDESTGTPASPAHPSRQFGGAPEAPALPRRTRRAEIASSGPTSDDSATGPVGGPGPGTSAPAGDGVTDSAPSGLLRPGRDEPTRGTSGASGSGRPPLGAGRGTQEAASGSAPLPRRVRQANLAPQLKQAPERPKNRAEPAERDADEVRSRMASLQRGWQRGREENAGGDDPSGGTAPQRTTKGDGR